MVGDKIDLCGVLVEVEWVYFDGVDDDVKQWKVCFVKFLQLCGDVFIMVVGVQCDCQWEIVWQILGVVIVENVDLMDVIDFVGSIDFDQLGDFRIVFNFVFVVIINVEGVELMRWIDVFECEVG